MSDKKCWVITADIIGHDTTLWYTGNGTWAFRDFVSGGRPDNTMKFATAAEAWREHGLIKGLCFGGDDGDDVYNVSLSVKEDKEAALTRGNDDYPWPWPIK